MNKKKGRAKTGAGPDPAHQAYLAGLKGIQSSLIDVDYIETEYRLFVLVAEEVGRVTVYAIDQENPEQAPKTVSKDFKFEGGVKITSASFSLVKNEQQNQGMSIAEDRALPVRFYVAVSCFDHVEVKVLSLTFVNDKFEFSAV